MIVIGEQAALIQDTPTLAGDALPGSVLVDGYMSANQPQAGDLVDTLQVDFISAQQLSPDQLYNMVNNQLAGALGQNGYALVAYTVYEKTLLDVQLPAQFCLGGNCYGIPQLCIPGTAWICGGQDCCVGGGSELASCYEYRLWIVAKQVTVGALAIRALGPVLFLVITLALIALAIVGFVIVSFIQGRITWPQVQDGLNNLFKAPGRLLEPAFDWVPWAIGALGFTMVASSLALGYVYSKGGAQPVVGPPQLSGTAGVKAGPVNVGVTASPGVAPPAPAGRRR